MAGLHLDLMARRMSDATEVAPDSRTDHRLLRPPVMTPRKRSAAIVSSSSSHSQWQRSIMVGPFSCGRVDHRLARKDDAARGVALHEAPKVSATVARFRNVWEQKNGAASSSRALFRLESYRYVRFMTSTMEVELRKGVADAVSRLKAQLEETMPARVARGWASGCDGFQEFRGSGAYDAFFQTRYHLSGSDRTALATGDIQRLSLKRWKAICDRIVTSLKGPACYICLKADCAWHHNRSQEVRAAETELVGRAEAGLAFDGAPDDPAVGNTVAPQSVVATAARNRLETLARFQCQWSGQSASLGTGFPLLVNFAFGLDRASIERNEERDGYTFDLRHAYLRVELDRSVLQAVEIVDFEPAPGERPECKLQAQRDRGGIEFFARWRLSGGAALNGRFDFAAVGYADQPHSSDKAFLQIDARDIRVKLDAAGELESEGALDVAKQWLRIRQILGDRMPENGVVTISEQGFDEE